MLSKLGWVCVGFVWWVYRCLCVVGVGCGIKKARRGPLFLICGVFMCLWCGRLVWVLFVA